MRGKSSFPLGSSIPEAVQEAFDVFVRHSGIKLKDVSCGPSLSAMGRKPDVQIGDIYSEFGRFTLITYFGGRQYLINCLVEPPYDDSRSFNAGMSAGLPNMKQVLDQALVTS